MDYLISATDPLRTDGLPFTNKWGILEVYEGGDYAGVIATWPNPDIELGKALLEEIDRVHELKSKGIKPEPKDWSELFGNTII